MHRPTTTALALAMATALGTFTPPVIAHAEEPATVPMTWDFNDGLQGWTVYEIPFGEDENGAFERGLQDTNWTHVTTGYEGTGAAALTSFGGTVERYGDLAHIALVSPVLAGDGRMLHLSSHVQYALEVSNTDAVHAEWAPIDGDWASIQTFKWPDIESFEVREASFAPPGDFQVRYRFVSDLGGSGVVPNQTTALAETFRLDDVRISHEPLLDGTAGRPVKAIPARGRVAKPTVVLALTSGLRVNPYHEEFRDRSAQARRHPSTYLPGYPEDAQALELSLDASTLDAALTADFEEWQGLDTDTIYWIPGTKFVAISGAALHEGMNHQHCDADGGCDLRAESARGTWAASRAAGTNTGACPDCRLAVFSGRGSNAMHRTADHAGWIDAATINMPAQPIETLDGVVDVNGFGDVDVASRRMAEDMLTFTALVDLPGEEYYPIPTLQALGSGTYAPGVINVGFHDSGHVYAGNEVPTHVVADACRSTTADAFAKRGLSNEAVNGMWTAAPWAMGHAGRVLLEARRMLGDRGRNPRPEGVVALAATADGAAPTFGPLADGTFTRDELLDVVLGTATVRPAGQALDGPRCPIESEQTGTAYSDFASLPVRWTDVPEDLPAFVNLGYGAADDVALDFAREVLHGRAGIPDRSVEDAWFALDDEAREVHHATLLWQHWSGGQLPGAIS